MDDNEIDETESRASRVIGLEGVDRFGDSRRQVIRVAEMTQIKSGMDRAQGQLPFALGNALLGKPRHREHETGQGCSVGGARRQPHGTPRITRGLVPPLLEQQNHAHGRVGVRILGIEFEGSIGVCPPFLDGNRWVLRPAKTHIGVMHEPDHAV